METRTAKNIDSEKISIDLQNNIEQNEAAEQIEQRMETFAQKLSGIFERTQHLQHSSNQIVEAIRSIDAITDKILRHTTTMSEHTITRLVHQSGALQDGLSVFKVE